MASYGVVAAQPREPAESVAVDSARSLMVTFELNKDGLTPREGDRE